MKLRKTLVAITVAWLGILTLASHLRPSEQPTLDVVATASASAAQGGTCAPAPKSTSRKIAIMGDSIMTTYRPAPDNATPATLAWPNLLATQANTHGWQVSQHGVGGSMASMYLPGGPYHWVAQQVRDAKPHIVTLDFRANEQIGSNGQAKQTPAQLKTNMLALIDFIRATSPNTQFLIVNPPVLWYHEFFTTTHTQADYAVKMWEVAQERGGCWLDMRPFFSQVAKDPDLPDDIHANNRGHQKFYVAIYTALLQTCGGV